MDLSVTYMGLELDNPLLLGASPLVDDLDAVRRAEDGGAAAIVMHSLFEEQLHSDQRFAERHVHAHDHSSAEASTYLPRAEEFALGPDEYLEQVRRIRSAVSVPVIGSLNGATPGAWLEFARLIAQAGADALELNVYRLETDPARDGRSVEEETLEMVRAVSAQTTLPLAVKLSPFHASLTHFANRVVQAGAAGLILFNRFYQPDIDLETIDVRSELALSTSAELPLRLRWLAILSARLGVTLAASGGVHSGADVLKAVAAGAHGVQLVSEVLQRGTQRFSELCADVGTWLELNGYASIRELRGSLNLSACPDPTAYERVQYLRMLNSWEPRRLGARSAPPAEVTRFPSSA